MSSTPAAPNTEAAILSRLIRMHREPPRPAAEYLLSLQFEDADVERMSTLSALAQEGALSPAEEAELDSYIQVGNLLAVIQSKARRVLQTPVAPR